jgi:hypothetical protein
VNKETLWRLAGPRYYEIVEVLTGVVVGMVTSQTRSERDHFPWLWTARVSNKARTESKCPIQGYAPTSGTAKHIVEQLLLFTDTLRIEEEK